MEYNVAKQPKFSVAISTPKFKDLLAKTFEDPNKRTTFIANVLSYVANNPSIQDCEAGSIVGVALIADALNLPMSNSLGLCCAVPYKSKNGKVAQFQIQYKGFIQLAIRTSQYKNIGYNIVYPSQYLGRDKFTGEPNFDFSKERGEEEKGIGYMAYIRMNNGFDKTLYMTNSEVLNHAKKYSKAYSYGTSVWNKDFDTMALKTVIKLLISKWGMLSIDLEKAIQYDQSAVNENGEPEYLDNPNQIEEVKTISDDDAKYLFELAKDNGGAEKVKEVMTKFGYENGTPSNEIKEDDYAKICEELSKKGEE